MECTYNFRHTHDRHTWDVLFSDSRGMIASYGKSRFKGSTGPWFTMSFLPWYFSR
jgi:hypothetical protein